jgi:outer membrane protein TolC
LRVARAEAGVTLAAADNAGLWEDPMVDVSPERMLGDVMEPWKIMGGIGVTLPISGRLQAEREAAGAMHEAEILRVADLEWSTRSRLREAWAMWSFARARTRVTQQAIVDLRDMIGIVERVAAAGGLSRLESSMYRIELASMEVDARRDALEEGVREQAVRRLLGLPPASGITLDERLAFCASEQPVIDPNHPRLLMAQAEYEASERELAAEIRMQYPDVTLGPGIGREEGERLVTLDMSIPLPMLNANRGGIAKARATREVARAKAIAMQEEMIGEAAEMLVELQMRRTERELTESQVIPLIDQQSADVRRVTAIGEVNLRMILDSVLQRARAKLRILEARREESLVVIRLGELTGRPAEQEVTQ